MTTWVALHPQAADYLGYIPQFVSEADPRPVREQLHANYAHGGGWRPMQGFTRERYTLHYPGDPPFWPVAAAMVREEQIYVYPCSIVMILQRDGSFEVARMD